MGNANGREEEGGNTNTSTTSLGNGSSGQPGPDYPNPNPNPNRFGGSDPNSPIVPPIFTPQRPVGLLPPGDGHLLVNDIWRKEPSQGLPDCPPQPEKGIPAVITWSFGGNSVSVEGSWDNWTSRKVLQRSGKDHTILLVLPSGIYHYRFIVDGESRYMPDLPHVSSEMGQVCNILDVHDYVPESLESIAEFEPPPSPTSSYGHEFPTEDDFGKDPVSAPPQLNMTVLGMRGSGGSATLTRPQHVVLNHLFMEKGWAATSQSVVSLGLTQRFESKYVTIVLYKPLRR